jgi:hypothetical protein
MAASDLNGKPSVSPFPDVCSIPAPARQTRLFFDILSSPFSLFLQKVREV